MSFIHLTIFFTAFMSGIGGSAHCIGMCSGIASSISFNVQSFSTFDRWKAILLYNLGRITSYTIAGALIGGVLFSIVNLKQNGAFLIYLRLFSALLMFILALHIAQLFDGIRKIEVIGKFLWRFISPIASKLMPLTTPYHAFPLGFLWGWLPCGLVYTALSFSATSGSAPMGALVMFAFGLGTLPSMLTLGGFSVYITSFFKRKEVRFANAALLVLFSLTTANIAIKQLTNKPMQMQMKEQNNMDHSKMGH